MNEEDKRLNYNISIPEKPLYMLRIFYPEGIQFKYIMYNINSGKYNLVNFTKNQIEPGEYNTEDEVIAKLESLLEHKVILEYQKNLNSTQ